MFNNRNGLLIITALLFFSCGNKDEEYHDHGMEFFYGSEESPGGVAISSQKDSIRLKSIYLEKWVHDLDDDWEYLSDELHTTDIYPVDNIYVYIVSFIHKPTDDIFHIIRTHYYDVDEWEPVLLKHEILLKDGTSHIAKRLERSTVWDGDFD